MKKKRRPNALLVWSAVFSTLLVSAAFARGHFQWSLQQRIPAYEADANPPLLVADRSGLVHAFSSQWLPNTDGTTVRAVMYEQWSLQQGWTAPTDILLSPYKREARVLDVFVDTNEQVHLIFWGGDGTDANIYYSSAPLAQAANSHAWLAPTLAATNAADPETGVFDRREDGQIAILFSGKQLGHGVYTTSSADQGLTWSKPSLVSATRDPSNLISSLQSLKGNLGLNRAIWYEANTAGQGRLVYYSQRRVGDSEWSVPVVLASADSGYGTNTPAIIEYHDQVLGFYNLGGVIWQRSSTDGLSWTPPVRIFPRHGGVNGWLSLVVDSNNALHMFFGQRISGSPDIHGMWHSVMQTTGWSEPEAVASGPHVVDHMGDQAFDPFDARAVVSQGNTLLVTWRSDPGNRGNGVWYSYEVIDAPALPVQSLPTTTASQTPAVRTTQDLATRPVVPTNPPTPSAGGLATAPGKSLAPDPVRVLVIGVLPVMLLIAVVSAFALLSHFGRR